jgi:hypothetical protein
MADDRLYEGLDIDQIKRNLALQKKLEEQRRAEDELRNKVREKLGQTPRTLPPKDVPPMPRYGGRPRGMDKSPEELRMEALQHMADREESMAIGEEKRRKQEEFESGYRHMGGSD